MNASVLYPSASMTNPALYHGDRIDLLVRQRLLERLDGHGDGDGFLAVLDALALIDVEHGIINDDSDAWLKPAFEQFYRVLKPDSMCISFYAGT